MEAYETIENAIKDYNKNDMLGYIGLIGNYNSKHDIDLLSIRNPELSREEHIYANVDLVDYLTKKLRKSGVQACVFPTEAVQIEMKRNALPDALKIHNLTFFDKPNVIGLNPDDFLKNIKQKNHTLYGSLDVLEHKDMQEANNLNNLYSRALRLNTFQGSVLEDFRREKITFTIEQITKYLGIPETVDSRDWDEEKCINEFKNIVHLIAECGEV